MNQHSSEYDKEELKKLLRQFENLKAGRNPSFLEEESFQAIVDHFNERDQTHHALEAVQYAIGQYPYSAALLIKKADLLLILRQYHEALTILEQAEILDPNDTNLYILKTEAYLALDQQQIAAQILEAALENFKGEEKIDLLFELADVYDDYEDFDKVFDCLKMVLDIDPINEEALYKICFWTDFTGRNEEGINLHRKIIDDYPFNELAWFNLGAAYQGLKLYEKSIDAYHYALAINDKFDYAWRNMGDAYIRLRKYKDAIEALEKVLELSRPEEVIYEAIGHCYDKMTNYAQARFNYRKASHLNKDDSQLQYKIACTYMNEANWEAAIKTLEIALQIHKLQPEYNLAMGQCYMEMNKLEDAITYLGNVVRVRPKKISGWIELLNCLYKAELFEDMLEYAHFAHEQNDKKPIFLFYKSVALFALTKSKDALLQLELGMAQNPKLIKKLIVINPSLLQNQQVVDIITKYKRKKP